MADTKQQVDHKAEALRCLAPPAGECSASERDRHVQRALVHSNLAIAEGQERVVEEIKAFRELMGNSAT